jgi:hypothetical protein
MPAISVGIASRHRIVGDLCPTCVAAVDEIGALGPTALETALFAHLGVLQMTPEPLMLNGLQWSVGTSRTPEVTPFDWLDLDRFTADLARDASD